jgi:uncharacterized protein
MVSHERATEVEAVLEHLTHWARRRADARALALVGSWAYGAPRENSDVDVVLLTDSPESYIHRDDWLPDVDGVRIVRTLDWGPITERRFALRSGLEVELGIATPAWASVDPLDRGTRKVVSDGMRALYDPDRLLALLAAGPLLRRPLHLTKLSGPSLDSLTCSKVTGSGWG